jgi:hypothetical protein
MLRSGLSRSSFSTASTVTAVPPYLDTPPSLTTPLTSETLRKELEALRDALQHERDVVKRLKEEGSASSDLSPLEVDQRVSKLKGEIAAAGAELPQRSTEGLYKEICSTDLLFLIDTTYSMRPHIAAAKDQIRNIVKDIGEAFLNEAEVRMAVVGYKDHNDKPNIQFLDFTTSADQVRLFLNTLDATGGDDPPEDVLGGIQKALNATWKHKTRCIMHIADAPPHGRTLHDYTDKDDEYPTPGTEPHGLTHLPLLQKMVRLNLNYVLLRINKSTDRMAFTFFQQYLKASAGCKLHERNVYSSKARRMSEEFSSDLRRGRNSQRSATAGLVFDEQLLGTSYSALRYLVVRSVTTSASRTAVRLLTSPTSPRKAGTDMKMDWNLASIDEDGDEEEEAHDARLDATRPQWNTPSWFGETLKVEGFSCDIVEHSASTLDDMMAHDDNIKMDIVELTIHKRSQPFAQGALRVAFYARTAASTDKFVVKTYKQEGKHFAHVAEDMRCQALCKAFALEFNALSGKMHSLDFIVTTCLKGKSSRRPSGGECMCFEPYIEGHYVKYNNNCGFVNEDIPNDQFNRAAQAFSHFTFDRSQGRFLVSDLQGVGGILTDPAVHTADPERFKLVRMNLNKAGFKFFFGSHVCNGICVKLGLKSNKSMIMSGVYELRQNWPRMDTTVCCSNKLCGKILRLASAKKSNEFPGHLWCDTCWPQLRSTTTKQMCLAPERLHEFEVSKFFYQSQGRRTPRKCPEHSGVREMRKCYVPRNEASSIVDSLELIRRGRAAAAEGSRRESSSEPAAPSSEAFRTEWPRRTRSLAAPAPEAVTEIVTDGAATDEGTSDEVARSKVSRRAKTPWARLKSARKVKANITYA